MNHDLAVAVRWGAAESGIRLLVTGCLTAESQRSLHPLIERLSRSHPFVQLTVDLTGADHIETAGYDLLSRAPVDRRGDVSTPAQLLLPDVIPTCPSGRNLARRPAMA